MTAKRFTFPVTLTLAVALALGVTSCAPDSKAVDPTPTVSASTPAVVEPTEAPAIETPAVVEPTEAPAIEAPVTGAVITSEQVATLPEGQKGFTLADGSIVVVTAAEPLPAVVAEALVAEATATVAANIEDGNAGFPALRGAVREAGAATGRNTIFVGQVLGAPKDDPFATQRMWTAVTSTNKALKAPAAGWTKDALLAAVTEFVATQDAPETWDVIVAQ